MQIYKLSAEAQERRKSYIDNHLDELSLEMRQIILRGQWRIGMTKSELYASTGKPYEVNRTVFSDAVHEQVIYRYNVRTWPHETTYFYFENGILTSWQD